MESRGNPRIEGFCAIARAGPQADDFYRRRCGMTDLGADPNYQNLRYFEMTEEQSRVFIEE